jgi:TonB family protein
MTQLHTTRLAGLVLSAAILLLLGFAPSARPQSPLDFLQAYVGQVFLIREHAGLHAVEKIKKEDAELYTGVCDKAVQVKAATFAKNVFQFTVDDIGLVTPGGNTPRECVRPYNTRMTKLLVIGFNGNETHSEFETIIGHVLQTPETYLASHGVALVPPQTDAQAPATSVETPPSQILNVTPWYPRNLDKRREPVDLKIEMTVGITGKVQDVQILSGAGSGLDTALLKVLPLWRYVPAHKDGQLVTASATVDAKLTFGSGRP